MDHLLLAVEKNIKLSIDKGHMSTLNFFSHEVIVYFAGHH